MTAPWPEPRPVSELQASYHTSGIYLVGWYDTPQICRATLSVFFEPLHDGTTHEWMALFPDPEDPKSGTARRIHPDVYWPSPTVNAWPRHPITEDQA